MEAPSIFCAKYDILARANRSFDYCAIQLLIVRYKICYRIVESFDERAVQCSVIRLGC